MSVQEEIIHLNVYLLASFEQWNIQLPADYYLRFFTYKTDIFTDETTR